LINFFNRYSLNALFVIIIIAIDNQYFGFLFLPENFFHILSFHSFTSFEDSKYLWLYLIILRGYLISLLYLIFIHIFAFQVFISKIL